VAKIDRFRGQWPATAAVSPERLNRIREAATVQSVAASCRLSGMPVGENEVLAVLRGQGVISDAAAIRGYATGLEFAFPANDRFVDQDALKALNRAILDRGDEPAAEGEWRTQELNREAFDAEGKALGWMTDDLLTWLEFELRKGEQHPVLVIGTFIMAFLAISPFEHGNGRTSRALIRHLLIRAGYQHLPFASVESELEADRPAYLEALFQARSGVWSGEANLKPWLDFFLAALERQRVRVETKLALERDALDFPPLQRQILETVREHGTVNASLLLRATGANRNTLKDNLRRMVDRGMLERTGQKRGTRYRLAVQGGRATTTTP
jgi:hypothetical protein